MLKQNLLIALIFILTISGCKQSQNNVTEGIKTIRSQAFIEIARLKNGKIIDKRLVEINEPIASQLLNFENSTMQLDYKITPDEKNINAYAINMTATLNEGEIDGFTLGLQLKFQEWDTENYVLMPGAVYYGNRFRAIKKLRKVPTSEVLQRYPGDGPLITNVPRLNLYPQASLLQQLSGDMATPGIGIYFKEFGKNLFILTPQGIDLHDYSFQLTENEGHDESALTIRIPGVREDSIYKGGGRNFFPSTDNGINLRKGDTITFKGKLFLNEASQITSLFDQFMDIRKTFGNDTIPTEIPFSEAWNIMETKYNSQNWVQKYGYYSVGMRESKYQDWQTGWVGGMNTVYPLLVNGSNETQARALQTFDFLFDTISPSGLFYEIFHDGIWYLKDESSFLRRNSDALYFIMKSFMLMKETMPDYEIPTHWAEAVKGCADVYVNLWNNYGEFGQQVEFSSGEITAPGSMSNGIACGALALCAQYFNSDKYLEVGSHAAEKYFEDYVKRGITNGGPGDIYQNIDSESAFGLLEAFVVLYETTQDTKWLDYASDLANQCASWVVTYNYKFPEESTFNKLDMKTTGTVIANVQNKHAAPGICTVSGNSLFKLYRYRGNEQFLELIHDIARSIPQYMSRSDRPITDPRPGVEWPAMPPGWINERVNLSDWEERGNPGDIKRGEIFGGSTWSEPAFMNTYAEIPGIYIIKDMKKICVIDHVNATINNQELTIINPTKFDATVNVYAETKASQQVVLPQNYNLNFNKITIEAGDTVSVELSKL